jgi:hypothetical protein
MPATARHPRAGLAHWAVLVFMVGFAILIVGVSYYYLLPAMDAAAGATDTEKRRLTAYSRLLLAVILFVLFVGLWMTFRVGRFFFPRGQTGQRVKTKYVDAWAESAKRMETPPRE